MAAAETKAETKAATRLQAAIRGHTARKDPWRFAIDLVAAKHEQTTAQMGSMLDALRLLDGMSGSDDTDEEVL